MKGKCYPSNIETYAWVSTLTTPIQHRWLEILASATERLKEIKVIQIGKGKINLSQFANDMTAYVDYSKNKCKTIPRVMKFIEYKINTKIQAYLYIQTMKKGLLKSQYHLHSLPVKYLGISLIKYL